VASDECPATAGRRVASKAQSAGLKPGLYKGEEGFLAGGRQALGHMADHRCTKDAAEERAGLKPGPYKSSGQAV